MSRPRFLRLLQAGVLVLGVAFLAVLPGCGLTGKLSGGRKANQAPHTVLFVNGPVDTVNHIAHLFWFGTDPDGVVEGFEWKMLNPRAPADSAWHFTASTDSIFTVVADSGFANPVFSVRAIDNTGTRDPNPPRETFLFSNQAPTVTLVQKPLPTDTTFASVSVTWTSNDPDGDPTKLTYLVWLNGNEASPEITTAQSLTMPTARFGALVAPAKRKLFVRAIDDGGRAGPPDSVTWNVQPPVPGATHARLLLVDDVPRNNALNSRIDTLYSNAVGRAGLAATQYRILRLDATQPFKTADDFRQTFQLFDVVLWYRVPPDGFAQPISTLLQTGEQGISDYLDGGGRFYLDGPYLIAGRNANGALSEDFVRDHLNSFGMVDSFTTTTTFADTSIGFGNSGNSVFLSHVNVGGSIGRDSLYLNGILQARGGEAGGFRQFDFKDPSQVVLWGAPGSLTPPDLSDSSAVGMSVPQSGGGRAILVCMPPAFCGPRGGGPPGVAASFITNIVRSLLLP